MSIGNSHSTVSVSKGCFVFKRKKIRNASKNLVENTFSQEPWYQAYRSCWSSVQQSYEAIEDAVFSKVLNELVSYVHDSSSSCSRPNAEIPAAALLVGVNMPDHGSLFSLLSRKLQNEVTPHVANLWSRDCASLRSTVERMCSQFMSPDSIELSKSLSDEESDEERQSQRLMRSQCNLPHLTSWYEHLLHSSQKRKKPKLAVEPLIIIIPDIESFPGKVFQDFILLLSGYQEKLPFFLVFGVATSIAAIHRSLPHHVSSCVNIKLFHIKPASEYLSEILEKVFLTPERHVHLGGKAFGQLRGVFLCYDFSITGFVQAYKYCMIEHFYGKNWTSLCCMESAMKTLGAADVEELLSLKSVRNYVENLKKREDKRRWIEDNNFVKNEVKKLLVELRKYVQAFYSTLRCLHVFTCDLPSSPIGKNLESIYEVAMSSDITKDDDFLTCMNLFKCMSRSELQSKVETVVTILQKVSKDGPSELKDITLKLAGLSDKLKHLQETSVYAISIKSPASQPDCALLSPASSQLSPVKVTSRAQFRKKLMEEASQEKLRQSPYEEMRCEILDCLFEDLFSKFLVSPCSKPLHEVMFFNDDRSLKAHILGSPRQAVFRALKDPHIYLQCDCCKLSSHDVILSSLPDVSIVYKLHIESGRLINMFDWLQAFLTIVNPTDEEQTEVDPKLQARFTQAVAELQFLGFIKSSSRKTDHVTRITWG